MKAFQEKLIRIQLKLIDNKFGDIGLLAGLKTFMAMNNLLKWRMLVVFILMVLIIGLEITSVRENVNGYIVIHPDCYSFSCHTVFTFNLVKIQNKAMGVT